MSGETEAVITAWRKLVPPTGPTAIARAAGVSRQLVSRKLRQGKSPARIIEEARYRTAFVDLGTPVSACKTLARQTRKAMKKITTAFGGHLFRDRSKQRNVVGTHTCVRCGHVGCIYKLEPKVARICSACGKCSNPVGDNGLRHAFKPSEVDCLFIEAALRSGFSLGGIATSMEVGEMHIRKYVYAREDLLSVYRTQPKILNRPPAIRDPAYYHSAEYKAQLKLRPISATADKAAQILEAVQPTDTTYTDIANRVGVSHGYVRDTMLCAGLKLAVPVQKPIELTPFKLLVCTPLTKEEQARKDREEYRVRYTKDPAAEVDRQRRYKACKRWGLDRSNWREDWEKIQWYKASGYSRYEILRLMKKEEPCQNSTL